MSFPRKIRAVVCCGMVLSVAACGLLGGKGGNSDSSTPARVEYDPYSGTYISNTPGAGTTTLSQLFRKQPDPNVAVQVNKYLWNASLDILNFLPIESVDPFSGVIVTGYGTPPGGGRAYRATILVQDPALDARSLKVSLQSKGGPVSTETQRAVEDAILTRARQLRIQDTHL